MKIANVLVKIIATPDNLIRNAMEKIMENRIKTNLFGLTEAIAYSWRIDVWQRYAYILEVIKMMRSDCQSILDVGGSGGTFLNFVDQYKYTVYILDIDKNALLGSDNNANKIVADGCRIPFKDNSFDVVISVDSVEHVEYQKRNEYLSELKRVAKKKVLLHLPAKSNDGDYRGEEYDDLFNCIFKRIIGFEDSNTLEHLRYGLPRIEDIMGSFPDSEIIGRQNCKVWCTYMLLERIPYIRLITGLLYLLFLQKGDNKPPYHACVVIWTKRHVK